MPQCITFTIDETATEQAVASVCTAALTVLWEDLEWFEIDLVGLDHDPDCAEAVAALQPLRRRHWPGRGLNSVAHVVPGPDDDKLPAVMPLLTKTIYSTGLSRLDAQMVFTADDIGTSCLFELSSEQLERLEGLLADGGHSEVLMRWRGR